jgi:hypothetical protein
MRHNEMAIEAHDYVAWLCEATRYFASEASIPGKIVGAIFSTHQSWQPNELASVFVVAKKLPDKFMINLIVR